MAKWGGGELRPGSEWRDAQRGAVGWDRVQVWKGSRMGGGSSLLVEGRRTTTYAAGVLRACVGR